MTVEAVASWILKFAQSQPFQARNAYSAFLLIPGWESIRFCTSIRQAKRLWETSGEKYGDFWEADLVLKKLLDSPFDWNCTAAVRDRTILCLRLFHLCRSVDLSQAERTRSQMGTAAYWKIKRKGAKRAGWEQLIDLHNRFLSPLQLLDRYVALTKHLGKPGGPVFLSLNPPFLL